MECGTSTIFSGFKKFCSRINNGKEFKMRMNLKSGVIDLILDRDVSNFVSRLHLLDRLKTNTRQTQNMGC